MSIQPSFQIKQNICLHKQNHKKCTCYTTVRQAGGSSCSIVMDAKLPRKFRKKRGLFLVTLPPALYILVLQEQFLNPGIAYGTNHQKHKSKVITQRTEITIKHKNISTKKIIIIMAKHESQ